MIVTSTLSSEVLLSTGDLHFRKMSTFSIRIRPIQSSGSNYRYWIDTNGSNDSMDILRCSYEGKAP